MPARLKRTAFLVLLITMPLGVSQPASAQQSYLFGEKRFRNACKPPLKYAAGTCVRRCPAGYQNMGRTCRLRSMRR